MCTCAVHACQHCTNTVHCFNVSLCHYVVIEEQNVRLKLTVTDTPGFGDQINNEKWYVICLMSYMRPCCSVAMV